MRHLEVLGEVGLEQLAEAVEGVLGGEAAKETDEELRSETLGRGEEALHVSEGFVMLQRTVDELRLAEGQDRMEEKRGGGREAK